MAWSKVSDDLWSHPKFIKLRKAPHGFEAGMLWLGAASWCAKYLTEGEVPEDTVRLLGFSPEAAAALVQVEMWERTADGYQFHDWLEYNPTKQTVETERERTGQRVREYRARVAASKAATRTQRRVSQGVGCNAVTNAFVTTDPIPIPDLSLKEIPIPSPAADVSPHRPSEDRDESGCGEEQDLDPVRGARWYADATTRFVNPRDKQHAQALAFLSRQPKDQLERAAKVLAVEREKRVDGKAVIDMLTPTHIAFYWRLYSTGEAPGKPKTVAKAPVSPVVTRREEELAKAQAEYRAACGAKKAASAAEWWDADQRVERARQEMYRLERIVQQQQRQTGAMAS